MPSKTHPMTAAVIEKAEPDEPMFVLLGRDRVAAKLVKDWADFRFRRLPNFGMDDPEEMAQIADALACAKEMEAYADRRQQVANYERIAAEKAAVLEAALAAALAEEVAETLTVGLQEAA